MSNTFKRIFYHIENSRQDVIKREKDHNRNIANKQTFYFFEASCEFINAALEIKAKAIRRMNESS